MSKQILAPAAQTIADATSKPPFLFQLGPDGARKVLDDIQLLQSPSSTLTRNGSLFRLESGTCESASSSRSVPPVPSGDSVRFTWWLDLGNAETDDRLVRELAVGVNAAVCSSSTIRSPEARYPVAIEQAYASGSWITRQALPRGWMRPRLAIAGDSGRGNMTAALTILASNAAMFVFLHQSLLPGDRTPRRHGQFYRQFANGPFLTAKAWPGSGTPICRTGRSAVKSPCPRSAQARPNSPVSGGVLDRGRKRRTP